MKGLALCSLLFGALVVVLVYAASNGIGMRTPSFAPVNYTPIESKSQRMAPPSPVVEVESNAVTPESMMPTMPAPEVKVSRVERRRKRSVRQPRKNENGDLIPAPEAAPAVSKPAPKLLTPKIEVKEPSKSEPEPQKEPEIEIHPRDVSDAGPMSQLESDRQWRRDTLARWRQEAQERRDGGSSSTVTRTRPGHEPSLKGTPAEGLFPAEGEKKVRDKKGKRRHRVLFIRW